MYAHLHTSWLSSLVVRFGNHRAEVALQAGPAVLVSKVPVRSNQRPFHYSGNIVHLAEGSIGSDFPFFGSAVLRGGMCDKSMLSSVKTPGVQAMLLETVTDLKHEC